MTRNNTPPSSASPLKPEQSPPIVCKLDRTVLNEQTVSSMDDMALSLFAALCGKNRGAFVLEPPDGNTYGCLNLPSNFWSSPNNSITTTTVSDDDDANSTAAGTALMMVTSIDTTEDLITNYQNGNLTSYDTLDIIDSMTDAVYKSTPNVKKDPYACAVNGLTTLECSYERMNNNQSLLLKHMRAVTLEGVLKEASWMMMTGKDNKILLTKQDFMEMKALGLTTVQIPIESSFLLDTEEETILREILSMAQEVNLTSILQIVPDHKNNNNMNSVVDNDDDVNAANSTTMSADNEALLIQKLVNLSLEDEFTSTIVALGVPSSKDISIVRSLAQEFPIMVSINMGDLLTFGDEIPSGEDNNIYAALDVSHSHTVADIASSSSTEDRSKLFYHESMACMGRSPIEYIQCYKGFPVFVSNGFDIGIDDCIFSDTAMYKDYGQCNRFNETVDSDWWNNHRSSFLKRQLFAYDHSAQLGWSYSAWKVSNDVSSTAGRGAEVLDHPSKLYGLSHIAKAGLFTSLVESSSASTKLLERGGACLNPPSIDFVLGDDTLSPTLSPPPDCGDGWWNYTTENCTYWIPPPEPSCAPAIGGGSHATTIYTGSIVGMIIGSLLSWMVLYVGMGYRPKQQKYDRIPN